jgi:ribose transport system permease protein
MRSREVLRSRLAALAPVAAMVVLLLAGGAAIPGLLSVSGINSMLVLASFLGIASAGQTIAVLLGGIDLSIPYVIGFADVAAAVLTEHGWPFALTGLIILSAAFLIGAFNGAVSSGLQIHPLLVTLGVGFVVQGGVQLWTGGKPVGLAPDWLGRFVSPATTIGPVPLSPVVLFWAGFAVAIVVLLRRTGFGLQLYAMGSNPTAAALALVHPQRVWTAAFGLSAACAALAGLLLLGFTGGAFAAVGDPYLFLSVGAVVVGGTSLLGGQGGYERTLVGTVILTALNTILLGVGLSDVFIRVFSGALIVVLALLVGRGAHVRARI